MIRAVWDFYTSPVPVAIGLMVLALIVASEIVRLGVELYMWRQRRRLARSDRDLAEAVREEWHP